ncbi:MULTISPECIES: SsgA family sporulation/cell division regulator [Streptomyces]|uniref:Cell division protein, regulatory protein n=1 Tax=Streptomyces albus (strain ATCC 21838 / DSM 41398 / FERM P-419 / JCM 4703 / NBRC 107858) TaxID=1081613 RepID=A0A0B5F3B3_STRA4|nr:SsgA family sporulation/cell division regulator [Streptomyces sp. SCSIO ZS0520]AJE84797.1 cell division protein, regulatory protein [Streptomyces albus]AOU79102.1 cell division protein, regulatory protein [Streptomyces albus]AYN34835.1 SsgA family sporulation/cell division regulator [Streptomyces albus]
MPQAIKKNLRARIVTDSAEDPRSIPVTLRYEPDAAPGDIRLSFRGSGEHVEDWVFARDLLERGMRGPVDSGDFRVWPCGRVQAMVERHNGHTVAMVQFDIAALVRFLRLTYPTPTPILR